MTWRPGESFAPRFWSKVRIGNQNDCWEWLACRNAHGYGRLGGGGKNAYKPLAHRAAWQLTNGDIPDGLSVCHKCDNRACVNPAHLFLGTHQDNMDDMHTKGRFIPAPIQNGEKNPAAVLTEEDVRLIRLAHETLPVTQRDIARAWGIRPQLVSKIVLRTRWKHVA